MIKKLILCFFLLTLALGVSAQAYDADARKATEEATALYQLDEEQAKDMYVIQERRFRNLSSIAPLRSSDYALYLQKKNATREGMMSSIHRLLKDSQMDVFNQQLTERRKKETALKAKLKDTGATREEIQMAIWEMD